MKRTIWSAVLGVVVVAGTAAWAGMKTTEEVIVSTSGGNMFGKGSLGSARNSPNDINQTIGCVTTATGSTISGSCFARDAGRHAIGCVARGEQLRVIQALPGDAELYFTVDAEGYCSQIRVSSQSHWDPKK
jgi:hypothetical protein